MHRRTSILLALISALLLSIIGVILIYSASRRIYGFEMAIRQGIWTVLGLIVAYVTVQIPRDRILDLRWIGYSFTLFLLILTLLIGIEIRGERSWLDFWLFHVQSAEIMKVVLVIVFASISDSIVRSKLSLRNGLGLLTTVLVIPLVLILLQPDLGTALIFMGFWACWFLVLGLRREAVASFMIAGGLFGGMLISTLKSMDQIELIDPYWITMVKENWLIILSLVFPFYFFTVFYPYMRNRRLNVYAVPVLLPVSLLPGINATSLLEHYQLQRLRVYIDPYQAPLRSGYNVIQSQIAIGSGGWLGQGYLQGSQSQLGFIPELWTDFIFSIAVEELGLISGILLMGLLFLLVYSAFSSAALSADWTGFFVCSGIGLIWILHSIVNLGVCVGLVPVIGLPLPFVSYGGSFMLINWLMVGLLITFSRRESVQSYFSKGEILN